MIKCAVCNQDTLGDWTGLCYLHQKYALEISGPYFETLYDLLYWKATFLKEWDRLKLGKIIVSCAPHVEVHKESRANIIAVKLRVQEQLKLERADLSMYDNLVRSIAYRYSAAFGIEFRDIYNEGMLQLKRLENRIEKGLNPNIISAWVKKSLAGYMQNYSMNSFQVVNLPRDSAGGRNHTATLAIYDDDTLKDDTPNVQEQYLSKERDKRNQAAILKLMSRLNFKQRTVMVNLLKDKPRTQTQLAKAMRVSQSKISYDINIIFTKAKEMKE